MVIHLKCESEDQMINNGLKLDTERNVMILLFLVYVIPVVYGKEYWKPGLAWAFTVITGNEDFFGACVFDS